jgi:hypothetical protein
VRSIDPSKLLGTDKFGISPYGTTLRVVYRVNDSTNVNVSAGGLDSILSPTIRFNDLTILDDATVNFIRSSLEVTNEEPIVGQTVEILSDELKVRAKNYYASQNRAVTKQDYEAICYNMPGKFGSIKRVNIVNDPSASNRKLALYVISENQTGHLVETNNRIKENLKSWLNQYKSINDQIEIFDAKILNFGIDFEVSVDNRYNKDEVINNAISNLADNYSMKMYIGEALYVTDIYNILVKTVGIVDVKKLNIFNKNGGNYSSIPFDFDKVISKDGSYYKVPRNVILELKFPNEDIKGAAK